MLQFREQDHSYTLDGKPIPSVTTILKVLGGYEGIPLDVLNAKAAIGTAVHEVCSFHLLNTLDESTIHDKVAPYYKQFLRFLNESGIDICLTETQVFSRKYWYAGTLDIYGYLNDVETLIDIKTCLDLHLPMGPQTAAYKQALEENMGLETKQRMILRLGQDRYQLDPVNDRMDLATFNCCLHIHNWKENRNGK